ncbi:MAG: hypothetical protein [Podoviridae sp. ctbj_2]|nr:MAG: hypothetical protein [Podoviridae sp. ctbj_2]
MQLCVRPLISHKEIFMAYEANSRIQVVNHYGARQTGASVGVERTTKSLNTLSLELTGQGLQDKFLPPFVLPQKAKVTRAWVTVDEAFSGVTNVSIGEGNAEATNGITLLAADLAVGARDVTSKLTGTWAATVGTATTAAHRVGLAVTGTPVPTQGRASVTIEYVYKVRDDTKFEQNASSSPTYPAQR